jgi:alkanesulfonate monooxygenase SsuD/methylene tetrahydromethanopterin reductase-like flavin-dependent oxidoreductase (luciferase family)
VQIGIGLPVAIPGAPPGLVGTWARRAEAAGFDSLAVIDRVVYGSLDPMLALATAAAVTRRPLLATTVLVAPLRRTALLARQVASLQRLSGGRLVLGVGAGAREDDYEAAGWPHAGRGRRLDRQLEALPDLVELGRTGTAAPMPWTLVGGQSTAAFARMARYADGYVHGGGPPRAFARAARQARAAWADACRPGRPLLWGQAYFAFGDAEERLGRSYLRDYYAFTGPFADRVAEGLVTSGQQLLELIAGYREAGCDHLCLLPTVASLDQLERLAEARAQAVLV